MFNVSDLPLNVDKYGVYAWDKLRRKVCSVNVDKQPYLLRFEIHIIIFVFHSLIFSLLLKIYFILL